MVNIHTKKVYKHTLRLDKGFKFGDFYLYQEEYNEIFDQEEILTFKFNYTKTMLTWYSEHDYTEITDKGWDDIVKTIVE